MSSALGPLKIGSVYKSKLGSWYMVHNENGARAIYMQAGEKVVCETVTDTGAFCRMVDGRLINTPYADEFEEI